MITGKFISDYIENLCRRHKEIKHGVTGCHFVNLNDDKQQTAQAETLRYPAVMFETSGYTIVDKGGSYCKRHQCRLQVVTHVMDTGDYAEIETALSLCDTIFTDFLSRMIMDKRKRNPNWLLGLTMNNIEVIPIENKSNALYGVLAELYIPEPICITDNNNPFND